MSADLGTAPDAAAQLSLNDVAERLGLHYVTVYRYVRQGLLPARQDGRRWLIDAEDLEDFTSTPGEERPPIPPDADDLRRALETGDEDTAWAMVTAAGGLTDPLAVQQGLIAPALREIGRRWSVGESTIAQEHRATVAATRIIARLGIPSRRGRRRGTVLVACPPGDRHTLATSLFANLVRSEGAEVIDLGRVRDAATIVAAASRIDGPIAVGLVVSILDDDAEIRSLVEALRSDPRIVSVVVGGLAVPDEQTARSLGSEFFCDTVEEAAARIAVAARG